MNPTIGQVASRNWHELSASQPHSLNGRPRSCQLQAAREVSKPRPFSAFVWSVLVRGSGEPVWSRFPEGRQAVALSKSWAPNQLKQCEVSPTCPHVAQGRQLPGLDSCLKFPCSVRTLFDALQMPTRPFLWRFASVPFAIDATANPRLPAKPSFSNPALF